MFILIIALLITNVAGQQKDVKGSCGKNCTWIYSHSKHTVKITGSGSMTNYDETENNQSPLLQYANDIHLIQIEGNFQTIGDYMFTNLTLLQFINIPQGVQIIGTKSFYQCSTLTSIIIPDSVTTIGDQAFEGTLALSSITYSGEKEPECGSYVFAYCGATEVDVIETYEKQYFCGKKIAGTGEDPFKMLYICLGIVGGIFLITTGLTSILTLIFMFEKPEESGYDLTIL